MRKSDKSSTGSGQGRLLSLDALRGFDMLWIIGGGSFLTILSGMASRYRQFNVHNKIFIFFR